jgi:hypothetical protein
MRPGTARGHGNRPRRRSRFFCWSPSRLGNEGAGTAPGTARGQDFSLGVETARSMRGDPPSMLLRGLPVRVEIRSRAEPQTRRVSRERS